MQNEANDNSDGLPRRGQARKLIASLIQSVPQGTHLTAAEVFQLAKDAGADLSLSTVYRTLGLLKAEGSISSVSGEHGIRYEPHDEDHDHDHLICLECGFTVEFVDELLQGFGQVLAKKSGYEFKRSRFDLYGLCEQCQSKSGEHKVRQAITCLQDIQENTEKLQNLINSALGHFESRKIDKGCETMDSLMDLLDHLQSELQNCASKFRHSQTSNS